MVLLQLADIHLLRYQSDWIQQGEYWRAFSAHWVHVNWRHLGLNLVGLILCMGIASPGWPIRAWISYHLILSLGISGLFTLLESNMAWYVGYSGVLYGLYILAAVNLYQRDKLISVLLGGAIITKIILEQFGIIAVSSSAIIGTPVIINAHLYGVLLAITIALGERVYTILCTNESV